MARGALAQLAQHVDGTGVDLDLQLHHPRQGRGVEQVAGEHHAGRVARWAEAGQQGALDFPQGHRIDLHPGFADQAQQVQVGRGFLRIAHHVEDVQLGDARLDGGGVIAPQRGAVLANGGGQLCGGEGHGDLLLAA